MQACRARSLIGEISEDSIDDGAVPVELGRGCRRRSDEPCLTIAEPVDLADEQSRHFRTDGPRGRLSVRPPRPRRPQRALGGFGCDGVRVRPVS